MRAAGYEPLEPYPGSGKPWRSRHLACGSIVSPRPAYLSAGRVGCTECAKESRRAIFQERADGAERAEADMRSVGLEPLEPYQNSQTPWSCRCTACEAVGTPRLSSVRNLIKEKVASGCATCNRRARGQRQREANTCSTERVTAGEVWAMVEEETRRATGAYASRAGARPRAAVLFDAEAAAEEMRARGYEPLVPYPGRTNATWPSRCTPCGHEGRPTFNAVRNGGQGCRVCRTRATQAKRATATAPKAVEVMRAAAGELGRGRSVDFEVPPGTELPEDGFGRVSRSSDS
ncbi:hypothetical protein ACFV5J_26015 [Streptomyces zaomyceticus]|uniref:hypothetical protein n=1 Tax=Streptomyces zaomyceticus TaxID=68286 RepID=UPI003660B69B